MRVAIANLDLRGKWSQILLPIDLWEVTLANVEKVCISLTTERVAALKAVVEADEYATTSEVVREAVRNWQVKCELRREDLLRLRRPRVRGQGEWRADGGRFRRSAPRSAIVTSGR